MHLIGFYYEIIRKLEELFFMDKEKVEFSK